MIDKITRGDRMRGLVAYLLREGPDHRPSAHARADAHGQVEVHTDPHVIASSAGVDVPLGRTLTAGEQSYLASQLDIPKALFETDVHGGYVWQLSLTNHRDDPELSDEQWAGIAREAMSKLGFDDGTKAACPWVAVRHGVSAGGNDHMHVAVSLVRENGTVANNWNDRFKMSELCRELEDRFALTVVGGRHAESNTQWPTREGFEIAQRTPDAPQPSDDGPRLTPAQETALVVRGVAAASLDEAEFVRRLHDAGYQVRPRAAPGDSTKVAGYSVKPIHGEDLEWRAGGKLAKDLALPRLREQWIERGGQPVADERAAWRSPSRPAGRHGVADVDKIPGGERAGDVGQRETRPVAPERWDDAVAWTRETTAAVEAGVVDPAAAARSASGVAAALSARLEETPGPLAALSEQLARQTHPKPATPRPATPPAPQGDTLRTFTAVALVALQGSRTGRQLTAILLVIELAKLAEAIAERNRLRTQPAQANNLRRSIGPVRVAAAASQAGSGPWRVESDMAPSTPAPPPPPPPKRTPQTTRTRPADKPKAPTRPVTQPGKKFGPTREEQEVLRRLQEQRDRDRGR